MALSNLQRLGLRAGDLACLHVVGKFDWPRTIRGRPRAALLPIYFQWLRTPRPEAIFTLTARPGHLRLFGRDTIGSLFRQALVARRQKAQCFSATTVIHFEPEHFQQLAGLVCYYNEAKFITSTLARRDDGQTADLVAGVDQGWRRLPQQFDASILPDEASAPGLPNFTGAFVGMACQDLAGTARPADFDLFEYRERSYCAHPGFASTE